LPVFFSLSLPNFDLVGEEESSVELGGIIEDVDGGIVSTWLERSIAAFTGVSRP
jgi:hypothetical protein